MKCNFVFCQCCTFACSIFNVSFPVIIFINYCLFSFFFVFLYSWKLLLSMMLMILGFFLLLLFFLCLGPLISFLFLPEDFMFHFQCLHCFLFRSCFYLPQTHFPLSNYSLHIVRRVFVEFSWSLDLCQEV